MRNFFNFLKSKVFLIQIGLAVLVFILLGFGVLQWLKKTTNHGEFVKVPDLSKLSITQMRKTIEENKLRYKVLDSSTYNINYPRFHIITQYPLAGNKVKENRKIYVSVNPSGYKKVRVPKIIQMTQRNAISMLRAVGLDVERITYVDEIGKDMVYRIKYRDKYITEGYKIPKTSKIELICGNGKIIGEEQIENDSI